MKLISKLLFSAFALLVIAYFVPGIFVDSVYIAIVAALILGLLNAVVRPVLFLLTLPITLLTLGLFSFIINAALFWFAASFIEGFTVENFWYAFLGSVFMAIAATISDKLFD